MAITKDIGLSHAAVANADLSLKLHYIAKLVTGGKFDLAGASDRPFGVITEAADINKSVTVQYGGIAKVLLGGTVAAGDGVRPDSASKGVSSVQSPAEHELGQALEAGVSGDIIAVMLMPR